MRVILVELPTPPGVARGVRVIFNPVFSNRCSLFRWLGPARYTDKNLGDLPVFIVSLHTSLEPPHKVVEEILVVDAIMLFVRQLNNLRTDHLTRSFISAVITTSTPLSPVIPM